MASDKASFMHRYVMKSHRLLGLTHILSQMTEGNSPGLGRVEGSGPAKDGGEK